MIDVEVVAHDVLKVENARLISDAHENLGVHGGGVRRVLILVGLCDEGEAEDPAHAARHREDVDQRQILTHRTHLDKAVNISGANRDQKDVHGDQGARDTPNRHTELLQILTVTTIRIIKVPEHHLLFFLFYSPIFSLNLRLLLHYKGFNYLL